MSHFVFVLFLHPLMANSLFIKATHRFTKKGKHHISFCPPYSNITYINIVSCKADVEIDASVGWAGGILGSANKYSTSRVEACYSMGTIKNSGYREVLRVGGIVGGQIYKTWDEKILNYDSSSDTYVELSYSTITSTIPSFLGIGSDTQTSKHVTDCSDITTYFKELYSEYSSYWNFNNQWTWSGTVNGQNKQVKCPRLAWE